MFITYMKRFITYIKRWVDEYEKLYLKKYLLHVEGVIAYNNVTF